MSTYVYLRCEDHDPPIEADDESGQHLYDLPTIRQDVANRARCAEMLGQGWSPDNFMRHNTATFLAAHPSCHIGIVDEYGYTHPLEGDVA